MQSFADSPSEVRIRNGMQNVYREDSVEHAAGRARDSNIVKELGGSNEAIIEEFVPCTRSEPRSKLVRDI